MGRSNKPALNPSAIKNKIKRQEVFAKFKKAKEKEKRELKRKREIEAQELGEQPIRPPQKTLDNTREPNESTVLPGDQEVIADEEGDEFSVVFSGKVQPKIMITTRPRPSSELFDFIQSLIEMIPEAYYYPRKGHTVERISGWAAKRHFTHMLVLSEKNKICNGMVMCALPYGPTAFFKVSNVVPREAICNHGRITAHQPELILGNFSTRLGHRVGRFLGSLFPHAADFNGRQVVTFHNQRDFVFVRHHRYIFAATKRGGDTQQQQRKKDEKMGTNLQELGPRFTLRLKWLQEGTFNTQFGEFEWVLKRKEMEPTRRTFNL